MRLRYRWWKRWCCLLPAALLLLATEAGPLASAQVIPPALPRPMHIGELMHYADRLALDDSQRAQLEPFFEMYSEEYDLLAQGEVANFHSRVGEMAATAMPMPPRADVERLLADWRRISARMRSMDQRLFDELADLLDEEQQTELPRVRLARERAMRLADRRLRMGGRPLIDLADVLMRVDLYPEERQAIDPLLMRYEMHFAHELRELHEQLSTSIHELLEAIEAAEAAESGGNGTGEPDSDEADGNDAALADAPQSDSPPPHAQQAFQVMSQEIGDRIKHGNRRVHETSRRWMEQMLPLLSDPSAQALRHRFYLWAYPESRFAHNIAAERHFDAALRIGGLDDELRRELVSERDETRRELDAILEEVIASIDRRDSEQPLRGINREAMAAYTERQRAFHQRIRDLDQHAKETIEVLLFDDFASAFREKLAEVDAEYAEALAAPEQPTSQPSVVMPRKQQASHDRMDMPVLTRWGQDRRLPAPMDDRDLAFFARILHLDEDRGSRLARIHESYQREYTSEAAELQQALVHTEAMADGFDQSGFAYVRPTAQAIDAFVELRSNAIATLEAMDDAFFDRVANSLVSEDDGQWVEHMRANRQRTIYDTMFSAVRLPIDVILPGEMQSEVDLSRLVDAVAEKQGRVEGMRGLDMADLLQRYERQAAAVSRERYERAVAIEHEYRRLIAGFHEADDRWDVSPNDNAQLVAALREAMQSAWKINQATLDELLKGLTDQSGDAVRRIYAQHALPRFHRDPSAADRAIEQALGLNDLTDEQLESLSALQQSHQASLDAISRQMMEAIAGAPHVVVIARGDTDWQSEEERAVRIGRLIAERNDRHMRTVDTLRQTLTTEQLGELGRLLTER